MYNKHLDAFMSVVENGSFSKAAEASHISRTALIQQINLLEDHLGFELFTRSSKGTKLTRMGVLFTERTREIMRLSADTISKCRALEDVRQIRIGTLPNLPLTILAPICAEYHRLYPATEIIFVERHAPDYLASFQNNEFDISADYMSRLVLPEQDICFTPLANDSFDCAVSPESELARKERLTLDDLVGKKVYLLAPNLAQAEDTMRRIITTSGKSIKITNINGYSRSLPIMCLLEGAVFIHYHINGDEYQPLVSLPLDAGQPCPVRLGLCYKRDASREVRSFVLFASEYCGTQLGIIDK